MKLELKPKQNTSLKSKLGRTAIITGISIAAVIVAVASFSYLNLGQASISKATPPATIYKTISDGSWEDCNTWSPGCPPLTLNFGDSLKISHKVDFPSASTLSNNGIIEITGSLSNQGTGLTITNQGQIWVQSGGLMEINGMNNTGAGLVYNYGETSLASTLVNDGIVFSDGKLNLNDPGTSLLNNNYIGSCGNVTARGDFINNGTIENCVSGVYEVAGNFNNNANGVLANMGTVNVGTNYTNDGVTAGSGQLNVCNDLNNANAVFWDPAHKACVGNNVNDPNGTVNLFCAVPIGTVCSTFNLPVEYGYLEVTVQNDGNLVAWSTTSEINSQNFEIERSQNGADFSSIGEVDANGDTDKTMEYNFLDVTPFDGSNFYRLKQIDLDGSFSYSKIIQVLSGDLKDQVSVFPNPSNGENIKVSLSAEAQTVQLFVYDVQGKLVLEKTETNTQPGAIFNLDFNSPLKPGFYFVKMNADGKWTESKFMVN